MQRSPENADVGRQADGALRAARARRMAWGLALLVLACYIGFMVLTGIQGPL